MPYLSAMLRAHDPRAALGLLCLLEPVSLEQYTSSIIQIMSSNHEEFVRRDAVQVLSRLQPAVLADHVPVIVTQLSDPSGFVRRAALEALDVLPADVLLPHTTALAASFEADKCALTKKLLTKAQSCEICGMCA